MNERALIAGPYHGTRAFASTVRAWSTRRQRSSRQWSTSSDAGSARPCSLATSVPPESNRSASARKASASVSASSARWSKNHRWLIWSRIVQPGAGVGVSRSAPTTIASRSSCSAVSSSHSAFTRPSSTVGAADSDAGGSGLLGDGPLRRCLPRRRLARRRLLGGGLLRRCLLRRCLLGGGLLGGGPLRG